MNDAGNHGASSPGETLPALLFMSPKMKDLKLQYPAPTKPSGEFEYYSKVEQSDLAPTIAGLLGFPVSKNNLGAFIPEFINFWDKASDKVQILMRNARQILKIVTAAFGSDLFIADSGIDPCTMEPTDINELACEWRKITQQAPGVAAAKELDSDWTARILVWLRKAQDLMSSMASNYDMTWLYSGQILSVLGTLLSLVAVGMQRAHTKSEVVPLTLVTTLYGIMMFASSYVEEEHHFWYWASTLWLAYLGTRNIQR